MINTHCLTLSRYGTSSTQTVWKSKINCYNSCSPGTHLNHPHLLVYHFRIFIYYVTGMNLFDVHWLLSSFFFSYDKIGMNLTRRIFCTTHSIAFLFNFLQINLTLFSNFLVDRQVISHQANTLDTLTSI